MSLNSAFLSVSIKKLKNVCAQIALGAIGEGRKWTFSLGSNDFKRYMGVAQSPGRKGSEGCQKF